MGRNTSIMLGDHFDGFIRRQLEAGRYGSASEVMRAGLRLLEEHEDRVRALQRALIDGEASGDAGPLDFDDIRRAARARAGVTPHDAEGTHQGPRRRG
ncbi:MAG: type II toxin-antitoxin system ParD family antitoxin [Phycisphaerales bacterium]|nr:type II toxin-antitoxin system ParD family antitoxin [Phycisphaerales bacterium]